MTSPAMRRSEGGTPDFTILGAGLMGPAMALALARFGYTSHIFEREDHNIPSPPRGRSINITLCTRGVEGLGELGLKQEVLAASVPLLGRALHRGGNTTFVPYGQLGEALYSISRDSLRALLLRAAAGHPLISIFFGCKCVGVAPESNTLTVQGARSVSNVGFSRLIAADGANSVVRQALVSRGAISEFVELEDTSYRELCLSPPGVDRLRLPLNALNLWPRGDQMLLGFPNLDGSITLSLHLPAQGPGTSFETIKTPEEALGLLQRHYFPGETLDHRDFTGNWAGKPGRMATIGCRPWSRLGQIVLVGDAAHSLVPSYGQGANAGLEDVLILSELIHRHDGRTNGAFNEFETIRRPETDLIADLCRKHLRFLRSRLNDDEMLLRQNIEQAVYKQCRSIRSLYYNISFTQLTYRQALAESKPFDRLVAKIREQVRRSGITSGGSLEGLVQHAVRRSLLRMADASPPHSYDNPAPPEDAQSKQRGRSLRTTTNT